MRATIIEPLSELIRPGTLIDIAGLAGCGWAIVVVIAWVQG